MLVLCRRVGESIVIGEDRGIIVTVTEVSGDRVRIGIVAPRHVAVHRQEVAERILRGSRRPAKPAGTRYSDDDGEVDP